MLIKKHILTIAIIFYSLFSLAQVPTGYYKNADGKSGKVLKSALHDIIDDHDVISYDGLWNAFKETDVTESGYIWDMYSDCKFTPGKKQCGNYSNICDCYNREHSFPKSWFDDKKPMYSDLFHLYPTDGKVNGMRSNNPFGETKDGVVWGKGKVGKCSYPGYSGTVFEPADEYKGDFARTYFYMLTRYMDVCQSWSSPMLSNGNFSAWALNMLLEWNNEDPVSSKEINRNNTIFSEFQHNRNPFIDYPELADKVFGTDNTAFHPNENDPSYHFQESFQTNLLPSGWDGVCVISTLYNIGTLPGLYGVAMEDKQYITTPKVNGAGELSFLFRGGNSVTQSGLKVEISTNGTDWSILKTYDAPLNNIVKAEKIDINNKVNNVLIRFSPTQYVDNFIWIDDICLTKYTEKPSIEVSEQTVSFSPTQLNTVSNAININVTGNLLTKPIEYSLSSGSDIFNISKVTGWNNFEGGQLKLTFTPKEVKTYSAVLTLSSDCIEPIEILLTGDGKDEPVPQLTQISSESINFGTIALNKSSKMGLTLKAINLNGDLTIEIDNDDIFTSVKTIKKEDAESVSGATFDIVFTPKEKKTYSSTLKIKSDNLSEKTVKLYGTGRDINWFENFEQGEKNDYNAAIVQCSASEWKMEGAIIGNLAQDKKFDKKSVRLKTLTSSSLGNGYIETTEAKQQGAGTITIFHASYGDDAPSKWKLQISQNGSQFSDLGQEQISSAELTPVIFNPMLTGEIKLRIIKTDTGVNKLNIDNISISDYDGITPTVTSSVNIVNFGSMITGQTSEKKSIIISGYNLSSDIELEISGDNCFNIIKNAQWNKLSGGEVEITFTPELSQNYSAKLSVKSANAEPLDIYLAGKGYSVPTAKIYTDVSTLINMTTKEGVTIEKKIKLNAENLTDDIYLKLNGDNCFSVTPLRIDKNEAMEGSVDIIIRYSPLVVGTHSTYLEITSDNAEKITIQIVGISEMIQQNLAKNNSFESWDKTGTMLNLWDRDLPSSDCKVIRESSLKTDGDYSVKLLHTGTNGTASISQKIVVEPGITYHISLDYFIDGATTGSGGRIWGTWENADGTKIDEDNLQPKGYFSKAELDKWNNFSITATAPANAARLKFEIRWYKNSTVLADNFIIEKTSGTAPYINIFPSECTTVVEFTRIFDVEITGKNLVTESILTINLAGDYFGISENKDLTVNAQGEINDLVLITYSPEEPGTHNAEISISGGGLSKEVGYTLTGTAILPPEPKANEASDITATTFTANWDEIDGINKYLLTVYDDNKIIVNDQPSESNLYNVSGLTAETTYYYYLKSATESYTGKRSNTIKVKTMSDGNQWYEGNKADLYLYDNVLHIELNNNTDCKVFIYDINSKLVFDKEVENDDTKIKLSLPAGVYVAKLVCDDYITTKKLIIK